MDTVTVETSELIGPALDWAVANCEGWEADRYMRSPYIRKNVHGRVIGVQVPIHREYRWFNPSTDWAQGGPIIEREIESLYEHKPLECWAAKSKQGDLRYGPTPLIAAMRCCVASKLGDTVQIPKGLAP